MSGQTLHQEANVNSSCDSCGAHGKVTVRKGKLELILCGHHFTRHEMTLATDGWHVAEVEENEVKGGHAVSV